MVFVFEYHWHCQSSMCNHVSAQEIDNLHICEGPIDGKKYAIHASSTGMFIPARQQGQILHMWQQAAERSWTVEELKRWMGNFQQILFPGFNPWCNTVIIIPAHCILQIAYLQKTPINIQSPYCNKHRSVQKKNLIIAFCFYLSYTVILFLFVCFLTSRSYKFVDNKDKLHKNYLEQSCHFKYCPLETTDKLSFTVLLSFV